MAVKPPPAPRDARAPSTWGRRLRLCVRLLGVTGFVVAWAGVLVAAPQFQAHFGKILDPLLRFDLASVTQAKLAFFQEMIQSEQLWQRIAGWMMVVGGGLALFALLVELLASLFRLAGSRSATGANLVLQLGLATALLVGVNLYSYRHFQRLDLTRDHAFTLPAAVVEQLRQLSGETEIVVYQQHKTFGQLSTKPDAYDYAAERKVVEKVYDLVEQFRELGPQFRVSVLDVEDQDYTAKLAAVTERVPGLQAVIDAAPENSIFFAADGRVQRLSFNDFYQLDKTASRAADDGRGNLVLLRQGVEPFARRVLAIEEKRPRVGVAVIHELLTTQGSEDVFTMAGVEKSLKAAGFDVTDLVLKKWGGQEPEPIAYSFAESKLERLTEELAAVEANVKRLRSARKTLSDLLDKLRSNATNEQLTKELSQELRGGKMTDAIRKTNIAILEPELETAEAFLAAAEKEQKEIETERDPLLGSESAAEMRRLTDLKAKIERLLADVDLLIVPRMTLRNVALGDRIPARLHKLSADQASAVRAFLKAGKPVLACFGPSNEPADPRNPLGGLDNAPDELETMLTELGLRFGQQTVLFTAEGKSFSDRRLNFFGGGGVVDVPPLRFTGRDKPDAEPLPKNPIAKAMQVTAASAGADLDLKARHPRPIGFEPPEGVTLSFAPEFLFTDAASWNEANPFPTGRYTPAYEPTKPGDPKKGTPDEERAGPFAVGVAVEVPVPGKWFDDGKAPERKVRVAAIGHGGLFVAPELKPAQDRLLVHTCNWLLGRDERLPRAEEEWRYPRVSLSEGEQVRWFWGALVGLPALFAWLGLCMWLVRRSR